MGSFPQLAVRTAHEAQAIGSGVDAVVVVDVLSFTTAVSVATTKGALIFPYPWEDGASEFAASKHADLAGTRAEGGLSLSPVSLLSVGRDDRVVLCSPNGGRLLRQPGAVIGPFDGVFARAAPPHALSFRPR
jgi:2-phosphosulfolactate phosphatase